MFSIKHAFLRLLLQGVYLLGGLAARLDLAGGAAVEMNGVDETMFPLYHSFNKIAIFNPDHRILGGFEWRGECKSDHRDSLCTALLHRCQSGGRRVLRAKGGAGAGLL